MSPRPPNQPVSPSSLVDGELVDRIRQLELFSRFRVESHLHGPNLSPLKGLTADFLQHRQYFRGDTLKNLDWRVYGKTGRFYIREFEELTNAQVSVLLDVSNSMDYKAPDAAFSKHEFAIRCVAIILYLAMLHKDSFALTLFSTRMNERLPFGTGRKHLHRLLGNLVACEPSGGTDFPVALRECSAPIRRRGLTLVLSDFMDDPERIVKAVAPLRFSGSDVIAMQVYDPAERDWDFNSVTRFHDLEGPDVLTLDPLVLRAAYRKEFEQHQLEMKNACQRHGFDHTALAVSDDYDVPLLEYVRHRMELFS